MQTQAIYIHFPWCIRKCPYCDFNSHVLPSDFPESRYVESLIDDFLIECDHLACDEVKSIFLGGGTPSLFSPKSFDKLFNALSQRLSFSKSIEITMEANPGAVERTRFQDYFDCGINRLSIGVQSFDAKQLQTLGRIHSAQDAIHAIEAAQQAGFSEINIDLMHGLPNQTLEAALNDLQQAIALSPSHLSWYQLNIEPNTYFYRHPPLLPDDEVLADIQTEGAAYLAEQGFEQYEVSAFSRGERSQCRHNLNYWEFGDYLALGAGAHGKQYTNEGVTRYWKPRLPKSYLNAAPHYRVETRVIPESELPFEYFLNTLRLKKPVLESHFKEKTGLSFQSIAGPLSVAEKKGMIRREEGKLCTTALGYRFLNDLLTLFVP